MAGRRTDDLIQGSTDLVVLSVLADEPRYGYAIIKQVSARSAGVVRLTPGVLYPLLHQMEKQGLLLSSWDGDTDGGGGGRQRKWYRLSAKGRRRLTQRAAAHRAYTSVIESFLPGAASEECP